jgi:hypothetical protein
MDFYETWNGYEDYQELVLLYFDSIAIANEPLEPVL